jgi:hypothetical protein
MPYLTWLQGRIFTLINPLPLSVRPGRERLLIDICIYGAIYLQKQFFKAGYLAFSTSRCHICGFYVTGHNKIIAQYERLNNFDLETYSVVDTYYLDILSPCRADSVGNCRIPAWVECDARPQGVGSGIFRHPPIEVCVSHYHRPEF